ncbi:MAG: hypothetical protein J2P15_03785 [Micromonosporaceae bacterium]|nr:hypothetical protein [Micromonosporaceae bacterium]
MIAASLTLIFVAIGLAALGVVQGSDVPLTLSIAASLLAVVALLVGQRRAAAARLAEAVDADGSDRYGANEGTPASGAAERARPLIRDRDGRVVSASAPTVTIPVQADAAYETAREQTTAPGGQVELAITPVRDHDGQDDYGAYGDYEDEDPPDEPPPQQVPAEDAERVARLSTMVLVVDGRPRYHLASCAHLAGRDSEEISVREAVELGFTPCSACEPDSALLAEAHSI